MKHLTCLAIVILIAGSPGVGAAEPVLLGKTEAELSGNLRGLLLDNLPDPLYDKSVDWGRTKSVKVPRLNRGRVYLDRVEKNDGRWRKLQVEALNPKNTLALDIRHVENPEPGKVTFTVHLAADVRLDGTQQHWESGLKLYSTSVRGRARVQAMLHCETTMKTEFVKLLPEVVLSFKVTKAETAYDNLVVEHVVGVGGEAAKLIGDAGHELIHHWKPSLERNLLERANRAVEKALADKTVRLTLSKLFKSKAK